MLFNMHQPQCFNSREGTYLVFVDDYEGEHCENINLVNKMVFSAFENGAMNVLIKREVPDLPKLKTKEDSGIFFISPD